MINKIIGKKYILLKKLGDCEDVFLAQNLITEDAVAVKMLHIDNEEDRIIKSELFRREFISLSKLNHKSIIKYIDSLQVDECLYLCTEFYNGTTLRKYVNETPISDDEKIEIAINIARALAYAHESGVIHRDLKPENIMIINSADVKIIDFGISKILNEQYDSEKTVRCFMTINYAAPEQLLRLEAKPQSDIYSFGLNLAFILSGEEPPDNRGNLSRYIEKISCSTELKLLIKRLTDFEEQKRPQSMYTVIRELEKEYISVKSKIQKLYIVYNSYIKRKLFEIGVLTYNSDRHLEQLIIRDLNTDKSYIYRNFSGKKFYVIGENLKYECLILSNGKGMKINSVSCIDDQIEWEKETERGIVVSLPWTIINNEDDCKGECYLQSLLQEIVHKEKSKKTYKDRNKIKNELLEKWNKYLQEEFSEIDLKKRICNYQYFAIDDTGYKIEVVIGELYYPIDPGEFLQMTSLEHMQITVGTFEGVNKDALVIKLNTDINPEELSKSGYIGIDVAQAKVNLKRLARALNNIKFSQTANPNLSDIIAEPAMISHREDFSIEKEDFVLDILKNSPQSANANAVKKALGTNDIFLIQGPPGTGKSTVVTEIICQILKNAPNAKILLASQSHVAVDHVINKVAKILPDKRIIRIGRTNKISEESQNLILAEQLTKWVEKVKDDSQNSVIEYLNNTYKEDFNFLKEENPLEKLAKCKNFDEIKEIILLTIEWHRRLGKLDEFDEIFASKASIIAATCMGIASRNVLNEMDFDWVIVDEAARATPLELLVPTVRGKKIILVGDHRQLPPVVNTSIKKIKLEEKGIRQSDLEKSLFEELFDNMSDNSKMILNNQYRMHPYISNLISDVFYPEIEITTAVLVEERNHGLDWWPKVIKWIDTSTHRECFESEEMASKKNLLEAKIILRELEKIESSYRQKHLDVITVSVISGYDAQKTLLNNLINPSNTEKWRKIKIIIDNVDAFQGSETDIVIYSLVRCNDENKIGFLSDERRLNVALSRGKKGLIIVGNIFFAEKARSFRDNPFVNIVRFIRRNHDKCLIEVYNEDK